MPSSSSTRSTSSDDGRVLVAGRLSEQSGSDRRLSVSAPLAYSTQMRGATDCAFDSESEKGCGHRSLFQPRGKVLEGTNSMNAMAWVRRMGDTGLGSYMTRSVSTYTNG
jgi:choline dehydrogenase-like flavoprotein